VILLFGTTARARLLAIVNFVCGNCHNPAAQRVIESLTKFSLFFIPLFTVSRSYYVECTYCGATTRIDKAQADNYVAFSVDNPVNPNPAPQAGSIDMGHLYSEPVDDTDRRIGRGDR
jgi:hypothetical protein